MKKNVIISIKGQQFYDGDTEGEEPIELITDGRYYKKDGRYYISYRESQLTGLGATVTTLRVEPGCVTLLRAGDCPTHLVFETGRRHVSLYEMAEGALTVALTTRSIHSTLSDEGGMLEVDYSIDMDGTCTGANLFQVQVRDAARPVQ